MSVEGSNKNVLLKFATASIATTISSVGTFGFNLMLVWWLPISEFGQITVALTGTTIIAMFARFGMDASILRFAGAAWVLEDRDTFRKYMTASIRLVGGLSILGVFIALLGVAGLASAGRASVIAGVCLAVAIIPKSLLFIWSSAFRAMVRPTVGALLEAGCLLIPAGIAIAVLRFFELPITQDRAGIAVLVSSIAVCAAAYLALRSLDVLDFSQRPSPVDQNRFFTASKEMALAGGLQTLAMWGGVLALSVTSADEEIAGFSVALRIVLLIVLYRNVVLIIVGPRLASLYESGDVEGFQRTSRQGSTIAALVCILPVALTVIFPEQLLRVFGAEYVEFAPVLVVLGLGQLVPILSALTPSILGMTDEQRSFRQATTFAAVLSIPATIVLSHLFDAVGAALGTSLYWLILGVALVRAVWRRFGFLVVPHPRRFSPSPRS